MSVYFKPSLNRFTWDVTKSLGQSKILRSSYFFFFVVPIFAKMLSKIPDIIRIPYFDTELSIILGLPFNWVVFFYASLFATIGNLLYVAFCPKLIKEYADFNDFLDSKRDGKVLSASVMELSKLRCDAKLLDCIEAVNLNYKLGLDIYRARQALNGSSVLEASIFYSIRDVLNVSKPFSRLLCLAAFGVSFLLIANVLCENILYVFRLM